jgi:ABC-type glycerol-3-phosphate transport system substrate-binding protein
LKKILIIGGAALIIIIIILVIIAAMTSKKKTAKNTIAGYPTGNVTLTYWRIDDDQTALQPIFDQYKKQHKNVTINYVKKDPTTYETDLINAIANGNGPDLFQIKNDWLSEHKDIIFPMPNNIISVDDYKKAFAPVAAQDLISNNQIYGIPYYVDTLALFYNNALIQKYNTALNKRTDLTNQQINDLYITGPPTNWTDFDTLVGKLTNKSGNYITQAGVALGTSNNVENSQDILSLLMIQDGTKMVSDDLKTPTFNLSTTDQSGTIIYPGTKALDFYTSFALPNKETYSWNSSIPDSLTAFIQGKTAMMINYSSVIPTIKNQAPDLNLKIAELPQIQGATNRIDYANFWAETVNKNSKYPQVAWDFLNFASSKDMLPLYTEIANRPTSRPDTANQQISTDYHIFVNQIQTATNWYKGKTPTQIDKTFNDMITAVVGQNQPSQQAINAAAQSIITLWQNK